MNFATSNDGKFQEVSFILREFGLRVKRLDGKGVEVQSEDVGEVAKFAASSAARSLRRPLITEDTGLSIDALRGFPGPYGSFVLHSLGLDAILKLLEDAKDRGATFRSALAYCEPLGEPKLFLGELSGRIAKIAAGLGGFGFDPIFIPDGFAKTMAQLTLEQKCRLSHRAAAVREFARWYLLRRKQHL